MKKTLGILGGIVLTLLSTALYAQTPDSTKPTVPSTTTWDPAKNPTVDSLTAPFKGKLLPPRPALTAVDIYPVIGKYTASTTTNNTDATTTTTTTTETGNVVISLDEQNKGFIWVEGLPQGKIKAMLRKSPATYKIPAQKTEDGKEVAEGTLIFDKTAGTLNIIIGKPYNSQDPASAFVVAPVTEEPVATTPVTAKGKTKVKSKEKAPEPVKPYTYTGTKVDATVMN